MSSRCTKVLVCKPLRRPRHLGNLARRKALSRIVNGGAGVRAVSGDADVRYRASRAWSWCPVHEAEKWGVQWNGMVNGRGGGNMSADVLDKTSVASWCVM